jgi:hypothetical protein
MIKSQELRIGNRVLLNNKYLIIRSKDFNNNIFDNINPVKLTEEILLKCGFLPCSIRDNHYTIKGHHIWLLEDRFYCDKNGVQLKYLHQLQNLYFALTGNDLIIEL